MRYYIVDKMGDVLGDFSSRASAEAHLASYSEEQIQEDKLEIMEGR